MKKLPIGIQDFKELREGDYLYVDKSKLLYQLVDEGKYYFLSRPRRFGKSMLVSTIRELFKGSKKLFEGLWIENKWDWKKKHPVIHLSFNEIGYQSLGLRESLLKAISQIAEQYKIQLRETNIALVFRELIQALSKENQVVLLIDEYDKPLIDYINEDDKLEENRRVLREFYSIIKNADPYLKFVLLTGVSRFSRISIFSDLNNLNDITIDPNFNSLVGYTQIELEHFFSDRITSLSNKLNQDPETLLNEIKQWYNGYWWTGQEKLYNPFSILSFFQKGVFQNFWFSTGTPNFLIEVLKEGYHFDFDELETGSTSLDSLDLSNPNYRSLLFQTGYLTIKDAPYPLFYTLGYPNKEVKVSLLQHLVDTYSYRKERDAVPLALKLGQALSKKDTALFISIINSLIKSIPGKIFQKRNEATYHAIIYTSLSLLGCYINAEVSAGDKIIDAVVKTSGQIYVIEFKYDQPPEKAIQQIREKNHAEPFRHDGREVVLLGVSFGREEKGVSGWVEERL